MTAEVIIDITLWASVAAIGFMVWRRGRVVALAYVRNVRR